MTDFVYEENLKTILYCALFLCSFPAFAITENIIDGSWIRVADGCNKLPAAQVQHLTNSGGWNGMQRRMQLYVEDGNFTSTAIRSLKCDPDFKLNGPDLISEKLYCGSPATNRGSVTFLSDDRLILVATEFNWVDNPWGIIFRLWNFEVQEDVLIMKSEQRECESGEYNVYFIRVPLS